MGNSIENWKYNQKGLRYIQFLMDDYFSKKDKSMTQEEVIEKLIISIELMGHNICGNNKKTCIWR